MSFVQCVQINKKEKPEIAQEKLCSVEIFIPGDQKHAAHPFRFISDKMIVS